MDVECPLCHNLIGGIERPEGPAVRFFCPKCHMEVVLIPKRMMIPRFDKPLPVGGLTNP